MTFPQQQPVIQNIPTPTSIDYTSRDFASIRQSLLAQAALVIPEWTGAARGDANDFGVVLIEQFAYLGDILSYYNDRVANEAYLSTATQRSSVLSHASSLGYVPRSASAATTALAVSVTTSVACIIPKGFQAATLPLNNNASLVFETTNDLHFPATTPAVAQTLNVGITEGVTVTDEIAGISDGSLDQRYILSKTPVISPSVIVRVVESPLDGGNVWFGTNSLLSVAPADNAFAFVLDGNDALTLIFGDGVNGRVPPRGSVIHASYRVGGGADGNVVAGSIVQVVDPTDVVFPQNDPTLPPVRLGPGSGIAPPSITVINPTDAGGGTDSETINSIRTNAPKALRALQRAVALKDYEILALTIPNQYISKARAVGNTYTNITLYVAASNGSQVTQDILNAVVDFFASRKMVGATVVAATPIYTKIDVAVSVIVDQRYDQEAVRLASLQSVQNLLSFANVDFGSRVSLAAVYSAALEHPGVLNVVISKLTRAALSGAPPTVGASDITMSPNEIPVTGTVVVTATGGVVNSAVYAFSNDGSGSPGAPTSTAITLLRADPNSVRAELSWNLGSFTTATDVQVDYLNAFGVSLLSTVVGPFPGNTAAVDLPLVGHGTAASIRFLVRAYNGVIGPVIGASVTQPYIYE